MPSVIGKASLVFFGLNCADGKEEKVGNAG
jgi:hypothetical protein